MSYPQLPTDIQSLSRFVDVDGIKTHYIEKGTGRPLVLLHGGGAGADGWGNWRGCIDAYAEHFRVLVPDMPGFGRTGKPSPDTYDYSQDGRNRHLAGFLDALEIRSTSLIGNSMGGATALGLAINSPERVQKLVLMGSAGLDIANPDPTYIKKLQAYDFTLDGMQQIMTTMTGSSHVVDPALVQYRHEIMQNADAQVAIRSIVRSKLAYTHEQIASVSAPTLVVGGKEDKVAVLARTYGYLELIRQAWGIVVPEAGHWVMIEAPEAFVRMTLTFLLDSAFGVIVDG
ncbi:alpha/beta hydrolase [Paraburkholderia ginsengiterrae]|uniref:Alpha/beta hydrolase n=1 Tax=Paraburkholderia ginsengiterrae TaxID=1462993 RepID=A0A1A9MY54_9BURK|nr:alpha/beta hydrolase [Paraburkholderia ginsengiterrae]OAJ52048.1 alpha/beta hydrolase [Paraburkholderia ginsengiterrae]OAJ63410.1 alpha/beta hydrolase [Paraburkholderia ginsengiterrae]